MEFWPLNILVIRVKATNFIKHMKYQIGLNISPAPSSIIKKTLFHGGMKKDATSCFSHDEDLWNSLHAG